MNILSAFSPKCSMSFTRDFLRMHQVCCRQGSCQHNKFELFLWFLTSYLTPCHGQLPENWASDAINCQKKRHSWAITCRISLWHSCPSETLRLLKWRISEMMSRTDLPISTFNTLKWYFGHHSMVCIAVQHMLTLWTASQNTPFFRQRACTCL